MAPLHPPAHIIRAPQLCALLSAFAAATSVGASGPLVAQDPGPTPELRTFQIEPDARGDGPRGIAFVRDGAEVAVLPGGASLDHGATWCFQVWHRDVAPSGSALTDALALYFR